MSGFTGTPRGGWRFVLSVATAVGALIGALTTGVAHAQTITREAETGVYAGGTRLATALGGYTGAGYVDGFTTASSRVTLTFPATPGVYDLSIRYSAPNGQKGFSVTINGTSTSGTFPATASGVWLNQPAGKVLLGANNTLSIGGGWGWYLVDSIRLVPATVTPPLKPASSVPVDPQATPEARSLLTFLVNNYGVKTLSGQHNWGDTRYTRTRTGKWPGLLSDDLIEYSPTRVQNGSVPNPPVETTIRDVKANGQVCSLIWHWNAPMHLYNTADNQWWRGFYTDASSYDIAYALANTGSPEYAALIRDLDAIAVQLKKFQNANIPVLWRPLHEAEGRWFWWGAKGPAPFVQLWRLMYDRYTNHHGLHNLIWVFTANSASQAWYPGDAYVDIVGTDAYPSDLKDPLAGIYGQLHTAFNGRKMLALTEIGAVPDIAVMRQYGVYWSWYAPWVGYPQRYTDAELVRLYSNPQLIHAPVAWQLAPPAAPNGFTAVVSLSTRIDLGWETVSGDVTGYRLQRAVAGGAWSDLITLPPSAVAYANTGLSPDTLYRYRLSALSDGGPSTVVAAQATTTYIPAAPTALRAVVAGPTAINLAWADNSDNEVGFKIERSDDGGATWLKIDKTDANTPAYSNTGLSPGASYRYRVRAYNSTGENSGWTNTLTALTKPATPAGLTATALSGGRIRLDWGNVAGETGYRIERSTNNTTWTALGSVGANVLTYTNSGLTAGARYSYRLRAQNASGYSTYTATVSAMAIK